MSKIRLSLVDLFLVLAGGVALAFWQQSDTLAEPFDAYPKLVSGLLVSLAIACLVQERLKPSIRSESGSIRTFLKAGSLVAGIALYIVSISTVGYFVSSFIYLLAMLQIGKYGIDEEFLETKTLITDSAVAVAITASIAVVFKIALNLVFPDAWLF